MTRLARLLLLSLTLAAQNAAFTKGRTHYAPAIISDAWTKDGAAPEDKSLTFDIIFKPRDADGLERRMLDIAHRQSNWLSEDEIASYIAPTADAKANVETALKKLEPNSMTYSRNRDTLTVTTTVEKAAKFFDAHFYKYSYIRTTGSFYKTHNYTIPPSIEAYISAVHPIATFPHVTHPGRMKRLNDDQFPELSRRSTPTCNVSVATPACIRALYQFDTYTPTTSGSTTRVGIMGLLGENFDQSDLDEYLGMYRTNVSSYIVPVTTIDNATNNDAIPTEEASLDTQIVASMIYPLRSGYYDLGTQNVVGDPFLLTFQYFLGLPVDERPPVITISYSGVESDLTDTQAASMCTAAQQLAAAGMTIVVSSGDSGVGYSGRPCPKFHPLYPSGCPYILSVGGTQNFFPEVMLNQSLGPTRTLYSGAGFSHYFPTPSFQRSVVSAYERELNNADGGYHNKGGRAYPDVSAQGSWQPIIMSRASFLAAGTSASAPIVASGIALLNDLLMKTRNTTVGWPHPMFYAHPEAFTDVESGGSYGCGSTSYGLLAKPGWDASSGLGTLSLPKLRAIYGV